MYCLMNNDNVITNIFVCESEELAQDLHAKPFYDGATIGELYNPPIKHSEPSQLDIVQAQLTYTALVTGTLLKEKKTQ